MITEIEDYFARGCGRCERFGTPDCSTRRWLPGLEALRALLRDAGLSEHVKWGHPCYMHAGRNIAVMGAFRDDFRLSFFDAALLEDPEGLLRPAGPNSPQPSVIWFSDTAEVPSRAPAIRALLAVAMRAAELGLKPERMARDLDLPEELVEAMDADPDLGEAFHALTPGRQRSYVIALASAKTAETRIRRIAKFRPQILAGKGALER